MTGTQLDTAERLYIRTTMNSLTPRFYNASSSSSRSSRTFLRFRTGTPVCQRPPWIHHRGGLHVCIGQTLALHEMVLILATILQKFRLSFAPEQPRNVDPEPLLAIRPKGGLRMTLVARV